MQNSNVFILLFFINTLGFSQPNFPEWVNDPVYGDFEVSRIDVTIDNDSLVQMYELENDHEYIVDVVILRNGVSDTIEDVGFSLRGNTSLQAEKKSFKISFNSYVSGRKYKGVEKLNLNGEHNDPSIIRSKLYWETLSSMHVPGARANHFEVYINNIYYGLYINIEHIDENFLRSRFNNKHGNFYKCLYPADLEYLGDNSENYQIEFYGRRIYELKTNIEEDDYTDLKNFLNQLNNNTTSTFKDSLERYFNVNAFLRTYAVDIATGNWDGYAGNTNNYYLYHNPETDKFDYIPYDTDNTYGIDYFGIDWGNRNIYNWQTSGNRKLITKIFAQQEYKNRFSFFCNQLQNRLANEDNIFPRIDSTYNLINPYVLNDNFYTLDYGFDFDDFTLSYTEPLGGQVTYGLKEFIQDRYSNTESQLVINAVPPLFSETRHLPFAPIAGDSIYIRSWIEDDSELSDIYLKFKVNNGGAVDSTIMYDNGLNYDVLANDGIYSALILPQNTGDTVFYYIDHTDNMGLKGREPRSGWKKIVVGKLPEIKINEWMAKNNSTVMDELGEFEDWIELYNNSNLDIFTRNIYLTDTIAEPDKWRLPEIQINPNDFLLFWADDDESEGSSHANFKLSSNGEFIGVYFYNGLKFILLDSVNFGQQTEDVSFGCFPDGLRPMILQESPTPDQSNTFVGIIDNINSNSLSLALFPNPVRNHFQLQVESKFSGIINLKLIDILGRYQMLGRSLEVNAGKNFYHIVKPSNLPKGVYTLEVMLETENLLIKHIPVVFE